MAFLSRLRFAAALVALLACAAALTVPAAATRGVALTPPMGWSSWTSYGCDVTGQDLTDAAKALVSTGLAAAGFDIVHVDDCWMGTNRSNGILGHQVRSQRKRGKEKKSEERFRSVPEREKGKRERSIENQRGRNKAACCRSPDRQTKMEERSEIHRGSRVNVCVARANAKKWKWNPQKGPPTVSLVLKGRKYILFAYTTARTRMSVSSLAPFDTRCISMIKRGKPPNTTEEPLLYLALYADFFFSLFLFYYELILSLFCMRCSPCSCQHPIAHRAIVAL